MNVPTIAFGGAPLGNAPETYGLEVTEAEAHRIVEAILASPTPFIDTARNYGHGRSESRIGDAVRALGGWPEGTIVSTKLDRDANDRFDRAQARRSLEQSLEALGLARVDILHLHDPEHCADVAEVTREAIPELFRMRDEGLCREIGLAAGAVEVMAPMIAEFDFDWIITHNRWTLANRNAGPLIAQARKRGMRVMNAAPYAGGALAQGAGFSKFVYQDATPELMAPVRAVEEVCARHGVPMGAAALQFSTRSPDIDVTIVGAGSVEHVRQTFAWANMDLPPALWVDLEALDVPATDPEANRVFTLD